MDFLTAIPSLAPWAVISAVLIYVVGSIRSRVVRLENNKVEKETWVMSESRVEKKLDKLEKKQDDQSDKMIELHNDVQWIRKYMEKNGGVK